MSPKPIVPSPAIQRLLDEGFTVGFGPGYLLVHDIPCVTTEGKVAYGTIVCPLADNLGEVLPPDEHQVWWQGPYPCHHTGLPIEPIRHTSQPQALWDGFEVQHRFSNKPVGHKFPDHYSKVTNYIWIIANEARKLDPSLDPRTFKILPPLEDDSVFRYRDTASSRADIVAVASKLAMRRIAFIGLGGTGAYALDLVAKTPAQQLHLFDGDVFLQHNAFRAPGAAAETDLQAKMPKVEYFARIYDQMRKGITPHPYFITEDNIEELGDFDFVFICVDRGPVRKLIGEYLIGRGIPFVDVGMDLRLNPERLTLFGTCRVTQTSPTKSDHFHVRAPMVEDPEDDLYRKAIQVADLNCVNAAFAVMRWKQFCGFYDDEFEPHNLNFSVNLQSLTRDEMPQGPEA